MQSARAAEPRLRLRGIAKRYAAPVLTDVDLEVQAGEVHALMGANGAGKSTLSRIVCGLTAPDAGEMWLDGAPYRPRGKRDAEAAGVQMVRQELNLLPTLSVAENLFLNRLPRRWGLVARDALREQAARALAAVGLERLDPDTSVGELGIGQQQLVEVAAALSRPCRLLVLDEPTAALTDAEAGVLFERLRRLRGEGVGIVYVSHRMDEIRRVCDRVTVMRDGHRVATHPATALSMHEVVQLMTGDGTAAPERHVAPASDEVALRVDGLSNGPLLQDVSLELRRGEVLGLAGLVGSGRTELLRAIAGADVPRTGSVRRGDGPPLRIRGPWDALRAGIGMVPEDRRAQALLEGRSVRANVTLARLPALARHGWVDAVAEAGAAEGLCRRLAVRCHSLEQPVEELSGGNQQKVVIARWLLSDCAVLLFDEPTRGVDAAAKATIHALLRELAAQGRALLVVSSELPELMAVCDRIAVLSAGRLVASFDRGAWSEAALTRAAFSGYAGPPLPSD